MADDRSRTHSSTDDRSTAVAQRRDPQAQSLSAWSNRNDPFGMLIDRFFEGFGWSPRRELSMWTPRVDVSQQGNEIVVCADLPGLDKKDVDVEISNDMLILRGERQDRTERNENGWARREVSYGSFERAIPLPEGTIADSAKAKFNNGVLEVRLQAPPDSVRQGRKVKID